MREPIQIVSTSMLEEAKKALAEAKKFQSINDELIERSLKLSEENAKLKAENKALTQGTANLKAELAEMEHVQDKRKRSHDTMAKSASDYIETLEAELAETKKKLEEAKQAVLGALILGLV